MIELIADSLAEASLESPPSASFVNVPATAWRRSPVSASSGPEGTPERARDLAEFSVEIYRSVANTHPNAYRPQGWELSLVILANCLEVLGPTRADCETGQHGDEAVKNTRHNVKDGGAFTLVNRTTEFPAPQGSAQLSQ